METNKKALLVAERGAKDVMWVIDGETYRVEVLPSPCPLCGAEGSMMPLPPPILMQQPDETTHVCNPAFGGCNHGFTMKEAH